MSEKKKDCCLMKTICTITAISVSVCVLHFLMNTDDKRKKKFVHAVETAVNSAVDTIAEAAESISAEIFDK